MRALLVLAAAAAHVWAAPGLEEAAPSAGILASRAREIARTSAPDAPASMRPTLAMLAVGAPAAARAWPGYNPLENPMLISFQDGSAALIGADTLPAGFARAGFAGRPVAVAARGPALGFAFRMKYELGGLRVTAVRANAKPTETARLALHERFHQYQEEHWRTRPGGSYDVQDARDVALAGVEHLALVRWLVTGDADAVRDFAAARLERRRLFPGSSAEDDEEVAEGTADYLESKAFEAMGGDASGELVSNLRPAPSLRDMPKFRAYPVGDAECRFLDRAGPRAWRAQIAAGRSPWDVVRGVVALSRQEQKRRLARLTAGGDYAALLERARESVAAAQADIAEHLRRFDSQPGIRVRWSRGAEGEDYFGGSPIILAGGVWLAFPHDQWSHRLRGSTVELSDVPVLMRDSDVDFFAPPNASIRLDGAAWTPVDGETPFHELAIEAPGVTVRAVDGKAIWRDGVLRVTF